VIDQCWEAAPGAIFHVEMEQTTKNSLQSTSVTATNHSRSIVAQGQPSGKKKWQKNKKFLVAERLPKDDSDYARRTVILRQTGPVKLVLKKSLPRAMALTASSNWQTICHGEFGNKQL
jgi:hypothetical protein